MTGFAELFAATHDVRVLVPAHPGFGGTPRPGALDSIPALAALCNTRPDQFGLQDVTVTGNSIGGWITAEIALLKSPRAINPLRILARPSEREQRTMSSVSYEFRRP